MKKNMFKKFVSTMLLTAIFSGFSVSAAVSTADSFTEDFSVMTWYASSRASGTGSVTSEKLDERHGLSAKVVPDSGKIYGAIENSSVQYTDNDILRASFEVYNADTTTGNDLIDIWVGSKASNAGGAPVFGFQIGNGTVKYLNGTWTATATDYKMDSNKWYQFDMIYNPANGNVKYYMNGVKIQEATTSLTDLKLLGIDYRGTGCYFDNISLTKIAASDRNILTTKGNTKFSENFDTYSNETANSTAPTGWKPNGTGIYSSADGGMKIEFTGSSTALTGVKQAITYDIPASAESIEYSYKIKMNSTESTASKHKAMSWLTDSDGKSRLGLSIYRDNGLTNKEDLEDTTKYSLAQAYGGTNGNTSTIRYYLEKQNKFKYDEWNKLKAVWSPSGNMSYYINDIPAGERAEYNSTPDVNQFKEIVLYLCADTKGDYVIYDDVALEVFEQGITMVKTADNSGNVVPFANGKANAGLSKLIIPSHLAAPTANDIKIFKNNKEVEFTGAYVDGLYTVTLNEALAGDSEYKVVVSEAVAGVLGGYTESFEVLEAPVLKINSIKLTDGETEYSSLPQVNTLVYATIDAKNTTENDFSGKLILAGYEGERLSVIDMEDITIPKGHDGALNSTKTITVSDKITKVNAFFWSGFDVLTPLIENASLSK